MNKAKIKERRLHPRLKHKLAVKIAANGYDFATSTQDVSCVGTCCHVTRYIPPFTRILVRLSLPIAKGNTSKNCDVECKGVVVRTDDASNGGFNIAIFFNEIKDTQRQRISKYINQFLP